ncbi:hypothetical protein GCM10010166_30010 [Couchioplanes caeruleus subsp. azureus]|nr:hypothetical protein GCM10010166_30010 [Couchioplanes caeruleus subsp. azureus]
MIWRLAYGLYRDHWPRDDGFCTTCRAFWPCDPHALACHGLTAALRRGVPAKHPHIHASRTTLRQRNAGTYY